MARRSMKDEKGNIIQQVQAGHIHMANDPPLHPGSLVLSIFPDPTEYDSTSDRPTIAWILSQAQVEKMISGLSEGLAALRGET